MFLQVKMPSSVDNNNGDRSASSVPPPSTSPRKTPQRVPTGYNRPLPPTPPNNNITITNGPITIGHQPPPSNNNDVPLNNNISSTDMLLPNNMLNNNNTNNNNNGYKLLSAQGMETLQVFLREHGNECIKQFVQVI
jgi:hypothetical protein